MTSLEQEQEEKKRIARNQIADYKFTPNTEIFEDLNEEQVDWFKSKTEEGKQDWIGEAYSEAIHKAKEKIRVEHKSKAKDKEEQVSPIEEAVIHLIQSTKFVTIQETGEILHYSNGVYNRDGEKLIEKLAEAFLSFSLNNSQLAEIKGHIRRRTYHKREEFDADINIINLENGLYYIKENRLEPHTPNYLSINQKPIKYDKNIRPKQFGQFIKQVLNKEDIRTAIEAMAYTFHRDYELEYIFVLFGLGANGKSVYNSVLTALHGRRNISNVTIKQILNNDFALSDLENKDVNIDSEAVGYIGNTATLKKLTSGSKQPIRIERKKQQAYDTIIHAKLFLSANKLPQIENMTDADSRRFIVLTFPNQFDGDKADLKLGLKLTTESELSGIFNVLMEYLRGIVRNGRIYINEKTIEERSLKYERTANPIKAFVNERCYEAPESYIKKSDLYDSFKAYCNKYKIPCPSIEKFGRDLKRLSDNRDLDFEIKASSKKIDGITHKVWTGLQIIPPEPEPTKQTIAPLLGDLR